MIMLLLLSMYFIREWSSNEFSLHNVNAERVYAPHNVQRAFMLSEKKNHRHAVVLC